MSISFVFRFVFCVSHREIMDS